MRPLRLLVIASLLAPGLTFAASREQQEMQRDIAQLQDQVRMLQSSFDQKMASIETLVQQALDAASKANTSVSVLSAGVGQTLSRELGDRLTPVAGLAAKVDNVANDTAEVRNAVADLTAQMNRIQQQLTDINNAIKVIQAPPAPPPAATDPNAVSGTGFPPAANGVPPVPAQTLFNSAMGDYSGGKADLAAGEFADFIRFYPDDPNAATAQFYIGQIHYSQGKYDRAVTDFDAVLERYPEGKMTPDAYFMKGMALKSSAHRDAAATEFRALIKKYPTSDRAVQAKEQLRAMGLSTGASVRAAKKRS
jgi:tol-pal system protein YbgF